MWVWILSITLLGSNPEHSRIAKFETKQDCQKALISKKIEYEQKGREMVGHCFYVRADSKGWW